MNSIKRTFSKNNISLDDVRIKNQKFFPFHNEYLYKSLYIGQIFNTFLIFSTEKNLIIIDQHAAHEQILFEFNMENYKKSKKEKIYIKPKKDLLLKLNTHKYSIIKTNLSLIKDIGFNISLRKNNTIFFHSCIKFYEKQSFRKFVNLFVREYKKNTNFEIIKLNFLKAFFQLKACKNSVKSGYKISEKQAINIKIKLNKLANNNCCPHGRPIMKVFTIKNLMKKFLRYNYSKTFKI